MNVIKKICILLLSALIQLLFVLIRVARAVLRFFKSCFTIAEKILTYLIELIEEETIKKF